MKLCNEKQKKSEKKITASLSRDKRSADTSTGLSGKISSSQEPAMPHPDKHPEEKVLPSSAVRRAGPGDSLELTANKYAPDLPAGRSGPEFFDLYCAEWVCGV